MSDLRGMDAEFAEKVLGLDVSQKDYRGWPCISEPADGGTIWHEIPTYTRSLDAAWAGVAALKAQLDFCGAGWNKNNPSRWEVLLSVGQDQLAGNGDHPAEALVRACLEAVK